jgi:hypothetical protein
MIGGSFATDFAKAASQNGWRKTFFWILPTGVVGNGPATNSTVRGHL